MSKDPSLVRKALFSENNNGNSDSKWFISQSSLKHNHNAPKIGTLLIVIIAIAVFFKYAHLLTGKSTAMLFNEASDELLAQAFVSSVWLQDNYNSLYVPFICGLGVTIFSWIIVYLDSDEPGLNPPSPFSPQKAKRQSYMLHRQKTCHLSYLVSAASGLTVFFLLLLSN